jgi:hypothetical protein
MDDVDFVNLDQLSAQAGLVLTQDVLAKVVAWDPGRATGGNDERRPA